MLYLNWCWYLCVPLPSFPSADWQSPIVILHTISGVEPAPSTPLYNISFIWASLGGYGYSYPWYPSLPPSLSPLSSYPQLAWDAAETINWWIVLETDQVAAPGSPQYTEGESAIRNLMRLMLNSVRHAMRDRIVWTRLILRLRAASGVCTTQCLHLGLSFSSKSDPISPPILSLKT